MGKERTIPDSVKDTVNLLLDQGVKVKEISNITKLSDGKIRSMRINKGRYGAVSRPHAPPSGPPRSINSGMEQALGEYLNLHPMADQSEMTRFLWGEFRVRVNRSTISRALQRMNYVKKPRPPRSEVIGPVTVPLGHQPPPPGVSLPEVPHVPRLNQGLWEKSQEKTTPVRTSPAKDAPPPCVLFLNGFPGVGKMPIAQLLQNILPESRLLGNHVFTTAVEAIEPRPNKVHDQLLSDYRRVAFDRLKKIGRNNLIIIMISCSTTSPDDVQVFTELVDVARIRRVPFISVNLTCEESVHAERLSRKQRTERRESGYLKKVKASEAQKLVTQRRDSTLLDPRQYAAQTRGAEVHYLEVDTTNMVIEDAVRSILDFMKEKISGPAQNL